MHESKAFEKISILPSSDITLLWNRLKNNKSKGAMKKMYMETIFPKFVVNAICYEKAHSCLAA